jgi:AcrR family transcriptional regulator
MPLGDVDTGSRTAVRLLEEAIRVIESEGESALNLRSISSACGVTTPIIYKHFKSRSGLVVAAQAERFRRAIASIAGPFAQAIEAAASLTEVRALVVQLAEATQHPDRARLRRVQLEVLGASVSRPDLQVAVDDALRSLIERSTAALAVAQSRGFIRSDAPLSETVWWYFGQVQGRWLIEQSAAPIDGSAWNAVSARAVMAVLFDD